MAEYTTGIDRLDIRSQSPVDERIAQLRDIFPEAFREGKIDFDVLQRSLGEWVEPGKERFGLTWPGKAECMRLIQQPSVGTLVPDRAGSVDFDATGNLIIEGDNLEVLKLLQKSYHGKVKMIYIDPPYNTGNDFIYRDDFRESKNSYRRTAGTVDAAGVPLVSNPETSGRYHSDWLSMMYPRLYLARNLLRDDGAILVSIDDHEVHNLRELMNEIFGEENFSANIVWQKKYSVSNDDPGIAPMHDHILVYAKSASFQRNLLPRTGKHNERYTNPDSDPRGPWASAEYVSSKSRSERPTLWYPIKHPVTGAEVWPDELSVWRYSQDKHLEMEREGRLHWGPTQSYKVPRLKRYLSEVQDGVVPSTWWSWEEAGHNDQGSKETAELVGRKVFSSPKPVQLLSRLITVGSNQDSLILDFFAGSGSVGHAVTKMNAVDGGSRKYILVQFPEPLDEPKRLDDGRELRTIADICRERVRRAGKQIASERAGKIDLDGNGAFDTGFRSYKLAESNFTPWNGDAAQMASVERQIELFTANGVPDRSAEDLLTEILLKSGYALTTSVEWVELAGNRVASVAEGALLVCLDPSIALEAVEAMAALDPGQIVCLEAGFEGDDGRKVNALQLIRARARGADTTIAFKVV